MTQPNYLDNHLYVLGGDLKQFRRHLFQMVDDLVFVTRHGALRNLRTMAKATRARLSLETSRSTAAARSPDRLYYVRVGGRRRGAGRGP